MGNQQQGRSPYPKREGPYSYLFKTNQKKVKYGTQNEQKQDQKFRIIEQDYTQQMTLRLGDFNSMANQKVG